MATITQQLLWLYPGATLTATGTDTTNNPGQFAFITSITVSVPGGWVLDYNVTSGTTKVFTGTLSSGTNTYNAPGKGVDPTTLTYSISCRRA